MSLDIIMSPTPDQLRDLAKRHSLTGSKAAALIHMQPRMWRYLVAGGRTLAPGLWELLLIKLGEHPGYRPRRVVKTG